MNKTEAEMKYPIDDEEFKALVKESIHEWLDDMWISFGKWTAGGLIAALLAAVVTFVLWAKGLPGH